MKGVFMSEMTKTEKKDAIKKHINNMLKDLMNTYIPRKIDIALKCGVLDIDSWEPDITPMIIPKTILVAALNGAADQYYPHGCGVEKQVKRDVKNLGFYI